MIFLKFHFNFSKFYLIVSIGLILFYGCFGGDETKNCNLNKFGHHCKLISVDNGSQQFTNLSINSSYLICPDAIKIENDSFVAACAECYLPSNCLENNECRVGSTGPTCEQCKTSNATGVSGYYRVGGACVKCPSFPHTLITAGLLLLLVIAITFVSTEFSYSVNTRIRQFINLCQFTVLTARIRTVWPTLFIETSSTMEFMMMSSSLVDCHTSISEKLKFFSGWATTLLSTLSIFLLFLLIDRKVGRLISEDNDVERKTERRRWRTQTRRLCATIMFLLYAPVTSTVIQPFACSDVISKKYAIDQSRDLFLYVQDDELGCQSFTFQTFVLISIIYFFLFSLFLPLLLLFFTLRTQKWNLYSPQLPMHGYVYESYVEKHCYWEFIILLRKFIFVVCTELVPISDSINIPIQLSITILYSIMIPFLRPYRKCGWTMCRWGSLNCFEFISSAVLVYPLSLRMIQCVLNIDYPPSLDYLTPVLYAMVTALWLILFIGVQLEDNTSAEDYYEICEEKTARPVSGNFWRRNKVGEGIDQIQLTRRLNNLNF